MTQGLKIPEHVAIILDGNGRWAQKRGLKRNIGHYFGGHNVITIANYANELGVKQLTVYAFSTENWKRPDEEVNYLMTKPIELLNKNMDKIAYSKLIVKVIGRKDRLSKELLETINTLEEVTKDHQGMTLNVCFDYGSYYEILQAVKLTKTSDIKEFEENLLIKKPVDLLIRTGGEYRLSNFLLWQSAYAEFYFTKKYWPSFNKKAFLKAIKEYNKRNRRFGGLNK